MLADSENQSISTTGSNRGPKLKVRLCSWATPKTRKLSRYSSYPFPLASNASVSPGRWAAIAKGAVCFGLEGIVHRRILPCHYGAEINEMYNAAIHDAAHNYKEEWSGITFNNDTMTWFAKMVRDETLASISRLIWSPSNMRYL